MKISTRNIQSWWGKRINLIIDCLKEISDSDIVILTEYRNNHKENIYNNFLNLWYKFIYNSTKENNKNSLIIASKIELNREKIELEEHSHRIIKLYKDDVIIYWCYFPQWSEKKIIFDFLIKEVEKHKDKKIIITGDINTGKHFIDENWKTFICSNYIDVLEEIWIIDAWRLKNKNTKEYSWYSHSWNWFRIDHFFISENLSKYIINCQYSHIYREQKISDHSLIYLELE